MENKELLDELYSIALDLGLDLDDTKSVFKQLVKSYDKGVSHATSSFVSGFNESRNSINRIGFGESRLYLLDKK